MECREIDRMVVGATLGLAIDGDVIAGEFEADGVNPSHKGLLKGGRGQASKQSPKGIVRGNAMRQIEKLAKEGFFGAPVDFNVQPAIGITDDGTNGDRDDIEQVVAFTAVDARVRGVVKVAVNAGQHGHGERFPFLMTGL